MKDLARLGNDISEPYDVALLISCRGAGQEDEIADADGRREREFRRPRVIADWIVDWHGLFLNCAHEA